MTKEEKGILIENVSEKFAQSTYFYILDAGGMTVAQVNKFRRICFDKGLEYSVIKNSIIKKALETLEVDYTEFNEKVLKGFSGVVFSKELGNAPAKLLKEFRRQGNQRPYLKGASIDASFFYGEESLESLIKVKSKQDVLAELVGLLQSPGKNLVSAILSGQNNLAGILKTLESNKENND
jgi:large subunit ribosomal protein L10